MGEVIYSEDYLPPLNEILIVGGGTAGWMTAITILSSIKKWKLDLKVTLVESENISPIGYRYLKKFTGKIQNNNTLLEINSHQSFVRNLAFSEDFDYSNLTNDLLDHNLLFCEIFFGAKICISDCESVFKTSMLGLHKDLNYFRKKNDE